MSQGFGREVPAPHTEQTHREVTRYLVVIDSGGVSLARLFLSTREQVAEFDAGTEEVTSTVAGLVPTRGAGGREWDEALAGHSAREREAALVYELGI